MAVTDWCMDRRALVSTKLCVKTVETKCFGFIYTKENYLKKKNSQQNVELWFILVTCNNGTRHVSTHSIKRHWHQMLSRILHDRPISTFLSGDGVAFNSIALQ